MIGSNKVAAKLSTTRRRTVQAIGLLPFPIVNRWRESGSTDPVPKILSVDVPGRVTVGEPFTISVVATNAGAQAGNWSTISISSPTLDEADDAQRVSIIHEDFNAWAGISSKGEPIINQTGDRIDAQYLIAEAGINSETYWQTSAKHRLDIEVLPDVVGTMVVDVRVTMTAETDVDTKFTTPSSAAQTDQQGYPVRRFEIKVEKPATSKALEGQVIDVRGDPVPEAVVELYASEPNLTDSKPTVVATTTADADGRFSIVGNPQEQSVLLVRDGVDSPSWFGTYELHRSGYDYSQTLTLSRQLLSAPKTALTPEGRRLGSVTTWRYVNPSDHAEQVFYTEIAETVVRQGTGAWEVSETNRPLTQGIVSLTVPDSITIAYRERGFDIPTGTLETSSIQESTDRSVAAQWHQGREPTLPVFELGPNEAFNVVTKTEREREASSNWFLSVLSLIVGQVKGLGLVGLILDIFGLLLSAPAGDDEADSVNLVGRGLPVDLNTNDVVSNSWSFKHRRRRERPSVTVHQVPIRFETDEEIRCIIEAGWEVYSDRRARFRQLLTVGQLAVSDSEPSYTPPELPNTIRIVDQRDSGYSHTTAIEYTLEVSGELLRIREDSTIEPEDQVQQGMVTGAVAHDSDEYQFSGQIIALEIDQPAYEDPAQVYLNGELVEPSRIAEPAPSHELRIEAGSELVSYQLHTTGHVLGKSLESDAELGRYTARGELTDGNDVLTVAGEIAYFDIEGKASVFLDGLRVDPGQLGGAALTNRIRIDGTDMWSSNRTGAEYSFTITGFVVPLGEGGSLEGSDDIKRDHVEGRVNGDADEYLFSGELEAFTLDDVYSADRIKVFVNGEEIET
jgi:hypothetical protein